MNEPREDDFPDPEATVRAVTFDLDGLMFNTEELYQESGEIILGRRGKEFTTELLDQMMGRPAPIALQLMVDYHRLDATPEQLAAETSEIFDELLPTRLAPMPGLLELLASLETAGIPKAIATSSGRQFVDNVLSLSRLADRFSFVLSSEDIVHGKPKPDVYLLAAERHGVAPAEMLVLEDSQIGCAAGVASGAYTVAVPHGETTRHAFPGAQFVADTLADRRIYSVLKLE